PPLLRLPYPSVDEARAQCRATNDGSGSLEPYQLVSQYSLEPYLKSVAEALPTVTVRYGCELIDFTQDAGGVEAVIKTSGGTETVRAQYLAGCDGGTSFVRRKLGIKLRGEGGLMEL